MPAQQLNPLPFSWYLFFGVLEPLSTIGGAAMALFQSDNFYHDLVPLDFKSTSGVVKSFVGEATGGVLGAGPLPDEARMAVAQLGSCQCPFGEWCADAIELTKIHVPSLSLQAISSSAWSLFSSLPPSAAISSSPLSTRTWRRPSSPRSSWLWPSQIGRTSSSQSTIYHRQGSRTSSWHSG